MCSQIQYKEHQEKKCVIPTLADDLWKGWELNPDCPAAYTGPCAQEQPPFLQLGSLVFLCLTVLSLLLICLWMC